MKSIISKTIALAAIAAILFSFTPRGGEGFEISLNGKLLLQQFGKNMDVIKTISLSEATASDHLSIRYYHCGKAARNRTVAIKDVNDKTLKEWHFKDGAYQNEMICQVKHLLNVGKTNKAVLKLCYSSSELPEGRQLASVSFSNANDHASVK